MGLVPGHAFSIVYDGNKSMDVETTCPRGFNSRDPEVVKEVEMKTGQKRSNNCREVRELGLISSIYSNRSADLCRDNRYYEALLVGLASLALDRANETGVQNVHAALTQWTKHLIEEKEFEKTLIVLVVAQSIAPKDSALRSNREACWQEWLQHVQGRDGEAAAQARRHDPSGKRRRP